jgi:hypothetical protein
MLRRKSIVQQSICVGEHGFVVSFRKTDVAAGLVNRAWISRTGEPCIDIRNEIHVFPLLSYSAWSNTVIVVLLHVMTDVAMLAPNGRSRPLFREGAKYDIARQEEHLR